MTSILGDIASPRLLVIKGALFVVVGVLATVTLAVGVMFGIELWTVLVLHAVAAWAWCRAYYFAFYVLERYAGSGERYAGVVHASRVAWRTFQRRSR